MLTEALRAGLSVEAFWEMTPRETERAIAAAAWRMEHERSLALSQAWHTAALMRTRRLPTLKSLMRSTRVRRLTPRETAKRQAEFAELKQRMGVRRGGEQHRTRKGTDPDPSDPGQAG